MMDAVQVSGVPGIKFSTVKMGSGTVYIKAVCSRCSEMVYCADSNIVALWVGAHLESHGVDLHLSPMVTGV